MIFHLLAVFLNRDITEIKQSSGYFYLRPYNTLSLVGAFSLAEVHLWLTQCLPEVPEKAPLTVEGALSYKNTFLNTILHCVYT
jgi:hypothetical protein